MLVADKVNKISRDEKAELLIFTEDQTVLTLSKPDRDGFRTIVTNDGSKQMGILWGSWEELMHPEGKRFQCSPEFLKDCRPEIEIGYNLILIMSVPSFRQLTYPLISGKPVKSIYVKRR